MTNNARPLVILDMNTEYTNLFFSWKVLKSGSLGVGTLDLGSKTSSKPCVEANATMSLLYLGHLAYLPLKTGYCLISHLTLMLKADCWVIVGVGCIYIIGLEL